MSFCRFLFQFLFLVLFLAALVVSQTSSSKEDDDEQEDGQDDGGGQTFLAPADCATIIIIIMAILMRNYANEPIETLVGLYLCSSSGGSSLRVNERTDRVIKLMLSRSDETNKEALCSLQTRPESRPPPPQQVHPFTSAPSRPPETRSCLILFSVFNSVPSRHCRRQSACC